jgi:hypothetical protein
MILSIDLKVIFLQLELNNLGDKQENNFLDIAVIKEQFLEAQKELVCVFQFLLV